MLCGLQASRFSKWELTQVNGDSLDTAIIAGSRLHQRPAHGDDIEVVIPPRSTAVLNGEPGPLAQRDRHLEMILEQGRLAWQKATDYGQRSLVETTMGRYKALIGPRLRARGFDAQQTEAAIGGAVLNRMLAAGRPDSIRRMCVIA